MNQIDELRDYVAAQAAEHGVPGVAIGIYLNGEEPYLFHGITSVENPLSVNENTLFQIGSKAQRKFDTVLVSRYGAYLTVQNVEYLLTRGVSRRLMGPAASGSSGSSVCNDASDGAPSPCLFTRRAGRNSYALSADLPHLHGLTKRITSRAAPIPTRKGPTPMTCV